MKLTVIFDGHCGVCTLIIRKLDRWDKRGVLEFRTCQSINLDGFHGVTPTKCLREFWAISDDGTVAAGSDAAALIATALLNNKWPYRIGRWPGVRHVLSFGYRWVANNRRRFPGETPWCQQRPEDCNYRKPVERVEF